MTSKTIDNLNAQVKKLEAIQYILGQIKTQIEWCYAWDGEKQEHSDEVIDAAGLEAYTQVFNDICKLYKLGNC